MSSAPITYRGVSQLEIADSLEQLCLRLIDLDVGPLTNAAVAFWMADDGVVAQIRNATKKTEIEAALNSVPQGSNFTTSGWLSNLYSDVLPNVFAKADQPLKIRMAEEIGAVAAWNGFWGGGRFHAFYPEDAEASQYLKDKLGIADFTDRVKFAAGGFRGAYFSYQVYAGVPTAEAIAMIVDYAQANDLSDECVKNFYGKEDAINMTPDFAQKVVDNIPAIQALGQNGHLVMKKASPTPPPAPKP